MEITAVDSRHLDHALSQILLYLELFFWSLQHLRSISLSNVSLYRTRLSRTNFLVPRKNYSRYLELSENVAHRNQFMKIISCVFGRVFLIEWYFN